MEYIKVGLIYFFVTTLIMSGCNRGNNGGEGGTVKDSTTVPKTKPIINFYFENSASMDGYVKGKPEIQNALRDYLTTIEMKEVTDSLNLFFINSEIIERGQNIQKYIEDLSPQVFRNAGGNRGTTDIAEVLDTVLSNTGKNEISFLATDGIFSPGHENPDHYLPQQRTNIKKNVYNYIQKQKSAAVEVLQLSANFDGLYYNLKDQPSKINEPRPYYIWIIGGNKAVSELMEAVPNKHFPGGVDHEFSITTGNKKVDYAVVRNSGNFSIKTKNPKTTIKNLSTTKRGSNRKVKFSVDADLSGFLLNEKYLENPDHYDLETKGYTVKISKAHSNSHGYTQRFTFTSNYVQKGTLSIKLKPEVPDWVEEVNDEVGTKAVSGKTYGIKYQIEGVYRAFINDNDYYTDITINIK